MQQKKFGIGEKNSDYYRIIIFWIGSYYYSKFANSSKCTSKSADSRLEGKR